MQLMHWTGGRMLRLSSSQEMGPSTLQQGQTSRTWQTRPMRRCNVSPLVPSAIADYACSHMHARTCNYICTMWHIKQVPWRNHCWRTQQQAELHCRQPEVLPGRCIPIWYSAEGDIHAARLTAMHVLCGYLVCCLTALHQFKGHAGPLQT